MTRRRNAPRSYLPAWILAVSGATIMTVEILVGSDAGVVAGIFLGAGALGAAALYAFEVRQARRDTPPDTLDRRTVDRLTGRQRDDIATYGWTPDDPRDPYR